MTQATCHSFKFFASDLTKLKHFLVDNLSRGIESEGIAFEQRSEFIEPQFEKCL